MKLDFSTTIHRISRIKEVLSKHKDMSIKNLARQSNIPATTTALYLRKCLKDICLVQKNGRERKVLLVKNKVSRFEKSLIKEKNKIDIAIELRKKGRTYSEIKNMLKERGFKIGDGTLTNHLIHVKINKDKEKRYIQKIFEDRRRAGKIGGKIRVSMNDFKKFQMLGTEQVIKKAADRISKPTKELIKEKIWIIGHCIFDGSIINKKGCSVVAYINKSNYLISKFRRNILKVYHLRPTDIRTKGNNVFAIRYCSIGLVKEINQLVKQEIPEFIMNSKKEKKIIFLKTFWDDEGAIHFGITRNKKGRFHININAEAFCENDKIRGQLIKLHSDIGLPIINYNKKIRISKKENLIKFKKYIGFSPKIYLSYPKSKFHGWEKRKLLNFALNFKSKNASNLYRKLWM